MINLITIVISLTLGFNLNTQDLYSSAPINFCEERSCINLNIEKEQKIMKVLSRIKPELWESLESLEVMDDLSKNRAYANSKRLLIRKDMFEEEKGRELENLIIHELAHIIDLGYMKGYSESKSLFKDGKEFISLNDMSLLFYIISWDNSEQIKKESDEEIHFASRYAQTDPFEDFAETFFLYIKHPQILRGMAEESSYMKRKYLFIKYFLFKGEEFQESELEFKSGERVWDNTKLGI